jgi:hypothetical protein
MSRDSLTRWGLLLNGLGAALLLICHFPFMLPSGDASVGDPGVHWPEFWHWTNAVGSVAGIAFTVAGICLQLRAIVRPDPDLP